MNCIWCLSFWLLLNHYFDAKIGSLIRVRTSLISFCVRFIIILSGKKLKSIKGRPISSQSTMLMLSLSYITPTELAIFKWRTTESSTSRVHHRRQCCCWAGDDGGGYTDDSRAVRVKLLDLIQIHPNYLAWEARPQ